MSTFTWMTHGHAPDRHRFVITSESGVPTVVSSGSPRFTDELFRYEPILELQEDPQRPESIFERPRAFLRDSRGGYLVLEQRRRTFQQFDAEGRFITAFGGVGPGPGEFSSNYLLQGLFDGVLSVFDVGRHRVSSFDLEGNLASIRSVPAEMGRLDVCLDLPEQGRTLLFRFHHASVESTQVSISIIFADGSSAARIVTPPLPARQRVSIPGGRPGQLREIPLPPHPAAVYIPGRGILISPGAEPVLRWFDLDGRETGRIRVEAERRILHVPDRVPPWTFVTVDDAGFYWLRVSEELDGASAPQRGYLYRVLSPEGEHLGLTRAPMTDWAETVQQTCLPVSVSGGRIMCIQNDEESGGKRLVIYRIVPAVPGLNYP